MKHARQSHACEEWFGAVSVLLRKGVMFHQVGAIEVLEICICSSNQSFIGLLACMAHFAYRKYQDYVYVNLEYQSTM